MVQNYDLHIIGQKFRLRVGGEPGTNPQPGGRRAQLPPNGSLRQVVRGHRLPELTFLRQRGRRLPRLAMARAELSNGRERLDGRSGLPDLGAR